MVTLEQGATINKEIFIAALCNIIVTVFWWRSVVIHDLIASATRGSGRNGRTAK
jgi:hypothetical protein